MRAASARLPAATSANRFAEVALETKELDVLTVEVSSFQLETIQTFRPSISLWLNFAPDHLDRYRSVAEYRAAKLRIFENQTADDVAIINAAESLPKHPGATVTFSAYADRADFRLVRRERSFIKTRSFSSWRRRNCAARTTSKI